MLIVFSVQFSSLFLALTAAFDVVISTRKSVILYGDSLETHNKMRVSLVEPSEVSQVQRYSIDVQI